MSTRRLMLHTMAAFSLLVVLLALLSQHVFDMQPCAWCALQRLVFLLIAALCWVGLALSRTRPAVSSATAWAALVLALCGITAASYQMAVAARSFSCAQTFADRFMTSSGLDGALPWLFGIRATCMDAQVPLLGIEYAWWSLAAFVLVALAAVRALLARP